MRPWGQRVPVLRLARGVRCAPELHGDSRHGRVHLHYRPRVQRGREHVCQLDYACDLHEGFAGCAELRVRVGDFDVRQRGMQRGGVLHQRVQQRPVRVEQQRHPLLCREQRLLSVGQHSSVQPYHAVLYEWVVPRPHCVWGRRHLRSRGSCRLGGPRRLRRPDERNWQRYFAGLVHR